MKARSGAGFFGIASKIGDPIPQLTTTVLVAPCFSKRQSEFQLLKLVTTFNKA